MTAFGPRISGYISTALASKRKLLFWAVVLVFVLLQFGQHLSASYAFPTPWPDESHFLWQAVGFQEYNTFFSPNLNPDRSIFWMPPVYLMAIGLCFKVFGVSLAVARSFSFAMLILSFLVLAWLVKRQRLPLLSILAAGIIFLNAPFVASGNIARPETMLVLLAVSGFLLMQSRQTSKGLAVLLLTPLIHPNGFLFVAGGLLYWGVERRLFPRPPKKTSRLDFTLAAIVILLWSFYGLYAAANWSNFIHDMSFQFARKAERDFLSGLIGLESLLVLLAVVVAIMCARKAKRDCVLLAAIAIPSWLVMKIGREMWYEIFHGLGLLLFSLIILNGLCILVIDDRIARPRVTAGVILAAVIGVVGFLNYHSGTVRSPGQYPDRMEWHDLRFPEDVPYLTHTDRRTVTRALDSICRADQLTTVQFLPRADAFLLPQVMNNPTILVSHPLFCERQPDLYVVHRSRHLPRKWANYENDDFEKIFGVDDVMNIDPQLLGDVKPISFRDRTEVWWYIVTPSR